MPYPVLMSLYFFEPLYALEAIEARSGLKRDRVLLEGEAEVVGGELGHAVGVTVAGVAYIGQKINVSLTDLYDGMEAERATQVELAWRE